MNGLSPPKNRFKVILNKDVSHCLSEKDTNDYFMFAQNTIKRGSWAGTQKLGELEELHP